MMKQILDAVIQYWSLILSDWNRYLETAPSGILWGVAGFFTVILILVQVIRFGRKGKKAGEKEPDFGPDDAAEDKGASFEEAPSVGPEKVTIPASVEVKDAEISEPEEETTQPAAEKIADEPAPEGFFSRLKNGLSKTRNTFSGGLDRIFSGSQKMNEELLEEIEELLITSDVGVKTTMSLVEKIRKKTAGISDVDSLKRALREEILAVIRKGQTRKGNMERAKPEVIMVVGVNGVGKTTTIGKLSARFRERGKKVLIVAADTFRAAAGEQLAIWAEKSGAQIVRHRDGADPASVAYDGVEAAIARGMDVVLVDTAGRLHTKVNLMEELKKIRRTIAKKLPDAPHEILMVLDATTGQNALTQAKLFHDAIGLTGIALTKLDGTAKGGIVIAICDALNIPLNYIGVGEKIDDLQEFQPEQFVEALF